MKLACIGAGPWGIHPRPMFPRLMRPALPLFLICLSAFAYFYQAGDWNQNVRFDLVRSLVEQQTSVIDDFYPNTGDLACKGPLGRCLKPDPAVGMHAYCDKAPGVSWLAVPVYAVFWLANGRVPPDGAFLSTALYVCTVFASSAPAAFGVVLFCWLLQVLGIGRVESTVFALGFGLATMLFPYSTVLFGHALAASLNLAAYALLARLRHGLVTSHAPKLLAAAGACVGAAVTVEYSCALTGLVLLGYTASFVRPFRRTAWFILGGAGPALALAAYHGLVFGSPITLPYDFSTQPDRSQGVFMGIGPLDAQALWGILLSPYRGLFFSQPWLLLAAVGLVVMARRQELRADAAVCGAIIGLFVWMNASMVDWPGGSAFAPRYLIPALPFLAVPAAAVSLVRLRGRALRVLCRLLVIALMAGSGLLMLVGTSVTVDPSEGFEQPFSQFLIPNFLGGELATNQGGIDGKPHPRGSENASWNLGQRLACLPGLWSLLPLGGTLLGLGLWLGACLSRGASVTVGYRLAPDDCNPSPTSTGAAA